MSSGLTFNINLHLEQDHFRRADAGAGRTAYFWESEKTHGESDRRHVFNAMVVYELPFGKADRSNALRGALVSGWRLSSITRLHVGAAVSAHRRRLHSAECGRLPRLLQPEPSTAMYESMAIGAAAICWARGRNSSTGEHS